MRTDSASLLITLIDAAVAQWIRLRFPSCCLGFETYAHHLRFPQLLNCGKDENKLNEAWIGPFQKRLIDNIGVQLFDKQEKYLTDQNGVPYYG